MSKRMEWEENGKRMEWNGMDLGGGDEDGMPSAKGKLADIYI
jgi:hypothetical protein